MSLQITKPNAFNSFIYSSPEPQAFKKTALYCEIPSEAKFSLDSTIDENLSTPRSLSPSLDCLLDSSDARSMSSSEQQDDAYSVLNSALNQKKKLVPDDSKFKTELCKNYSETGQCPYGKKCKFAHGRCELNEKKVLNKGRYKSKKCTSFHNQMTCCYGVRCLFAHEERNLQELVTSNYYEKYYFCPELLEAPVTQKRRRLPVFSSATSNLSNQGFMMGAARNTGSEEKLSYFASQF